MAVNLTKPRRAVLEVVKASTDHPTAADVIERLRERNYKLAYATVYNSLRYLTQAGLIREIHVGEGISRYDGRTEDHHHVVCEKCGSVAEVTTGVTPELMRAVEAETGFQIHEEHLYFRGLCPKCKGE